MAAFFSLLNKLHSCFFIITWYFVFKWLIQVYITDKCQKWDQGFDCSPVEPAKSEKVTTLGYFFALIALRFDIQVVIF